MTDLNNKCTAEWFLTLHDLPLEYAHKLVKSFTPTLDVETETAAEKFKTMSLYDTTTSAEEGLWSRSGWAGRG